MTNRSATLLILAFLTAGTAAALLLDRPPFPVSASAPASDFSAERAANFLADFAQQPHPIGSAEHDHVRDYLMAQLRTLGLKPEVQRTIGVTPLYQVAGTVENVVARLSGTNGCCNAVMLAAHYDSVPAGPGAGDDGAGVAALLETVRALRAGPQLKNDVIFLFSDGEEDGMLGASAFVADHPYAKDVRMAINLEARGNSGDSQLFETSTGNARIVQLFGPATSRAAGSSFTYEIYKRMPNDTDLTVFKQTGAAGLNFAFIGHWEAYHTPLDNPDALDRGSLQRHGNYALQLARGFGNTDLTQLKSPSDAVFFSLPGGLFWHYPSASIRSLLTLAIIALFATWFYALGAYQTGWREILSAALWHLLVLLLLMLGAFLFAKGVAWLHSRTLPDGDIVRSVPYTFSLILLLTGVAALCYGWIARRITWPAFFIGGAAVIAVVNIAAAKWFAGGTYVLTWPLLVALLASVFAALNRRTISLLPTVALCLLTLPLLALLVPLLRGFFEALGLTPVPVLVLPLWILLIVLIPIFETLLAAGGRTFPLLMFAAGVGLFALGARWTHYSAEHPKPNSIMYALDADSQRALWVGTAPRVDSWSAQYLGNDPKSAKLTGFLPDWLPYKLLQGDAPDVSLPAPQVDVLENTLTGDTRNLRLRLTSPRHARVLDIEVDNPVLHGSVNSHALGQPQDSRWNKKGKWSLGFANLPPEGIDLRLQIQGSAQVHLTVVDRSGGLPAIPGATFAPRPSDSMPQHSGDQTLVRRTFTF